MISNIYMNFDANQNANKGLNFDSVLLLPGGGDSCGKRATSFSTRASRKLLINLIIFWLMN